MWPFSKQTIKGEKLLLKINGLHCTSCVLNIDGSLEDLKGVFSSQTNYAKSQTQIQYDPALVSIKKLIKTIEEQGYQVESNH